MAAAAVAERGVGPGSSAPCTRPGSSPAAGAVTADYSVLVVVGALQTPGVLELVLRQIDSELFVRSIMVRFTCCTSEDLYNRSIWCICLVTATLVK
ncbi:hypothetical protein WMY93_024691 [Mugilogobius chulae]|uniref:Uncharacterized protein n=1 Tax=Mugilogobius chulae TaxID=88201 RepID=A0AAW0NCW4_9GOBI